MRVFTAAALISFCSTGALHAAKSGAPFHWTGPVAAGKTLTIKGLNGSIHVDHSSAKDPDVTAVRTANKSNPDDVKIYVNPTAEGYAVCAIYPGGGNDCRSGNSKTHDNDTQVEFTVHLPSGVRLNAQTVNGSISGQGLRSDVDAATVNGKVEISTLGSVSAASVNGNLQITMGRADWSNAHKIRTVNGSIDVDLPASAAAEVHASTVTGGITSDFPLTVKGGFTGKSVAGTIGGGGRQLEIVTVNGSIHLRKHNAGAI